MPASCSLRVAGITGGLKSFPKAVGCDAIPQAAGLGSVSSAAFRSSTDWKSSPSR